MAVTGVYKRALRAFLTGDLDLVNNRLVAVAVDISAGYTVDLNNDEYISDLPAGSEISRVVLTGKSVSDAGEFRADDVIFPSVTAGSVIGAVIIARDTGYSNSSRLIYYTDTAAGLPITGDGDNVVVQWPDPILE